MKKVKVIQIGITHEHAAGKMETLQAMPEFFEIAGFVDDRKFCHTPRLSDEFPPCFQNVPELTLEEALNYPGLELALIEVPNNDLVDIAMQFALRGIPMHMDKPAGEDLAEYRKLLDICAEKNLPFQMGYMFRGNPTFQYALEKIRSGALGEIVSIEADMNHEYGGDPYQDYISSFPGGIMYNLGCHLIDFVIAALGRPEKVTAFMHSAPGTSTDKKNNALAVLEYPQSYAVIKTCSKVSSQAALRNMRICGTSGSIEFSPFGGRIKTKLRLVKAIPGYDAGEHIVEVPPPPGRYTEQLRELALAIRGEGKLTYSLEHDYLVHEATLAASGIDI